MVKSLVVSAAIAAVVGASGVIVVSNVDGVYAQSAVQLSDQSVSVPITTVVRGDAGSEKELKTVDLENGEYKVSVTSENQSSVHPDSNIVVRSNGDEVRVNDVESESFKEASADGTLTVNDGKAVISLQLGKDKVFSGGVTVVFKQVIQPPEKPELPEEEPEEETPAVLGGQGQVGAPAELPATGMGGLLFTSFAAGAAYISARRIQK